MVAIDGGETSQDALNEAENIANSYNAALRIVYCISANENKKSGNDLLEKAEASVDALSIETQLLQSDAAEYGSDSISGVIAAAATEWGADLLVLGTTNRRDHGLGRFIMGSVAERLVSRVSSSVLLVRPGSS